MKVELKQLGYSDITKHWHVIFVRQNNHRLGDFIMKWFITKPTARQVRKFKKEAKQWL